MTGADLPLKQAILALMLLLGHRAFTPASAAELDLVLHVGVMA